LGSASQKIVVAMSGGVDSSVAAALLCREGNEVVGLTLRLQPCDDDSTNRTCCGTDAVRSAAAVCKHLGIRHEVIDGRERFEQFVLRKAWEEYATGRTPNPCARCNPLVKFHLLAEAARNVDASRMATGHHARIQVRDGETALLRGQDQEKDQSYFLFALSREQLAATLFPVGVYPKDEVRRMAAEFGLPNADRKESQDACVDSLGEGFAEALRLRFGAPARAGNFVDTYGKILGTHTGVHQFTVGQRRGLGVALGRRAYVIRIDPIRAEVEIDPDGDRLLARDLVATQVQWLTPGYPERPFEAGVQIRYRHRPARARMEPQGPDKVRVVFEEPQRAITPGQAAVFFQGERVLGGGWIQTPDGVSP
jgi:tRNA-uridine 2-sulfurtransferase